MELIGLVSACCTIWVADDLEEGGLEKDGGLGGILVDPTSGEIADLCRGIMTVAVQNSLIRLLLLCSISCPFSDIDLKVLGSTGEVTQWHLVGMIKGRR